MGSTKNNYAFSYDKLVSFSKAVERNNKDQDYPFSNWDKRPHLKSAKKENDFYKNHLGDDYSSTKIAQAMARQLDTSQTPVEGVEGLSVPKTLGRFYMSKIQDSVFSRTFDAIRNRFEHLTSNFNGHLFNYVNETNKSLTDANINLTRDNLAKLFNFINNVFRHSTTLSVKDKAYSSLVKTFKSYNGDGDKDPVDPLDFLSLDSLPQYTEEQSAVMKSPLSVPPEDLLMKIIYPLGPANRPHDTYINYLAQLMTKYDDGASMGTDQWRELKKEILDLSKDDLKPPLGNDEACDRTRDRIMGIEVDEDNYEKVLRYIVLEAKHNSFNRDFGLANIRKLLKDNGKYLSEQVRKQYLHAQVEAHS